MLRPMPRPGGPTALPLGPTGERLGQVRPEEDGLTQLRANLRPDLPNRPIDGIGSNEESTDWGASGQQFLRLTDANYDDGIGDPASGLPNARAISNAVARQDGEDPSSFGLSDLFWVWGQFIDHDITLTGSSQSEFAPITVPTGDAQFDPLATGEAFIPFSRTDPISGTGETSTREYANGITAFIDASMIYGSDDETAASLRVDGGKLLLGDDNLLVATEDGGVFAGDVRAAENVALTSMQTLFAREHNTWVDRISNRNPDLTDDQLYGAARVMVEAEIQAITFNEFLPLLLGGDVITNYEGYDTSVNPGISLEFATAAFRFGHSLLSPTIQRLDENGNTIEAGDLSLSDAFFSPDQIPENGGIDPILRGLADGTAQELDTQVVEDVRSFLFGAPGSGGLDLAALNIERGRDLGVASYNDLREALGLARADSFADITSDTALAAQLESVYGEVDLVEAWIGGLAEDPHGNGVVGELFSVIILDQFLRLRDGDPFWSQGLDMPDRMTNDLWSTTLADVIERNTDIVSIQDNALLAYNRIGGSDVADTLTGGENRDLILGLAGDDILAGGEGDDQLEGGGGNDRLEGGAGNDILYGGSGSDLFLFTGGFGVDIISDFGRGPDGDGDSLEFSATTFVSSETLLAAAVQDGRNTVIDFGDGNSITLIGVDVAALDADDILFA